MNLFLVDFYPCLLLIRGRTTT